MCTSLRDNDLKKMITISKMYYENNMTQEDISKELDISISQVSRTINKAKQEGYIKISVIDPFKEIDSMRRVILKDFNLKDVQIVESRPENSRITEKNVAQAGADYLLKIIQTNDIVGIAFSDITSKIPSLLPERYIENLSFVQLNGALTEHVKGYQYDTVRQTAIRLHAKHYYFPAPAVVDNRYIKTALHQDGNIKWVINMAEKSNIALYSVGIPSHNSIFVRSGYFTSNDMEKIKQGGAVGEIFGHFIDKDGELYSEELDSRILGMKICELRKKDYSICVVAGQSFAEATYAALKGNYCNVLITDVDTAKCIIDLRDNDIGTMVEAEGDNS